MRHLYKIFFLAFIATVNSLFCIGQIKIVSENNAQKLVQKLLGPGVSVSNVSITGPDIATGFFFNTQSTQIGLDSGIVLTNGRAKSIGNTPVTRGLDGDKVTAAYELADNASGASSSGAFASNGSGFPGDADLTSLLSPTLETNDATVLEFDFVPLGDSLKFRYVFSSEEYPEYPCQNVNDIFAFFINGPGFPGKTNIALIPGSSAPVTIDNINNVAGCGVFPQFYLSNKDNKSFTHNGHTTVFTALAKVQPCQTYHLKLAIADVSDIGLGDDIYDSGVFLEAGSLTSNSVKMQNLTQTDANGDSYLVEGCATGAFKIKRPAEAISAPLTVNLNYAGTFTNGVDVQPLPASVTIPANQTEVTVNVLPIIDNVPEGIETIKIYALAGCASGLPTDSATIQLRDYDTLGIHPDTSYICAKNSVQLIATSGYITYTWDPNPTLSSTVIPNPLATPTSSETMYYCTAQQGTCRGRDSAFIKWKTLDLVSKKEINCKDDANGQVVVQGSQGWLSSIEYSINNGAWQPQHIFNNLPVGIYKIKARDASGCIDSITVPITQLYPDLLINNIPVTPASCSGAPDGTATVNMIGGKDPYQYSSDGINYQLSNVLHLTAGSYTVSIKDNNGCSASQNIVIALNNTVTLEDGNIDPEICESQSTTLNAVTNADAVVWSPSTGLDNIGIRNPVASPAVTTKYYTVATTGICHRIDSVTVIVHPAPMPNAGPDSTICFGQDIQLQGSGGASYSWKPSSYLTDQHIANPFAQRLPGTFTYYLYTISSFGCPSLISDAVTITVTRPAIVHAGRDTSIAVGAPLQLLATDVNHVNFTTYLWTPSYGLNDANSKTPVAILDRDVYYTVIARTANGCEGTDDILVKAYRGPDIYVPNTFTPNNDTKNDILFAKPVGIVTFHYFRIYDRWGNMVFFTGNESQGWDGKVKGRMQENATYVWMAEGIDYKGNLIQRKGTVMIIK